MAVLDYSTFIRENPIVISVLFRPKALTYRADRVSGDGVFASPISSLQSLICGCGDGISRGIV
jgi:hypothetical protein